MISLAAIGLTVLAAFEITVSPDQPLPYSYTDDPLIVEVRSDAPCVAEVQITATPSYDQPPKEARFEKVTLGPDTNRWCAMKDLPTLRGPWALDITITSDGHSETLSEQVYRIDRPANTLPHALYAYGDKVDRNTLLALRSVAINTVRVPATHEALPALLDTMATLDMRAIIRLGGSADDLEIARALSTSHCDVISAWVIPLSANATLFTATMDGLRGLACQKPVQLALPRSGLPLPSPNLAETSPHLVVSGASNSLEEIRETLALRRMNAVALDVTLPLDTVDNPGELLPRIFEYTAQGAQAVGISAALIYANGKLQPGLSRINGLIHRIHAGAYAGRIIQPGTTRSQIFTTGDRWLAAVWRSDSESPVEFPWSEAHPLSLLDEWGNGLGSSPGSGGKWTHPLSGDFLYVTGLGGPVLKEALIQRATREAKLLTEDEDLKPVWSEALWRTLATIAADPADVSSRVQFFALLRAFPEIEERWHAGQLSKPMATAALTRIAGLARTLCQLEAALGASFLEPLSDTLARCEEFQSAYLTGVTTTDQARARGDWLVAEVRRLMDEAEGLAQVNQRIEADAVAALAEWRARALESAIKAGPLSDQMTVPEESPAEAEAPAEKSKTESTKKRKK